MHPSGARLFRRGGLLFAAVAVTAVATAAASLWVSLAAIERDPNLLPPGDQSIASADTSINVLLISADAAKGADVADIVTLLHIDADRRDVQLIDIPRELAITGSAAEPRVLADVYTDDGAAATVEAVEQTVGIRVQHVALASLSGTSRLIDLLGGVPVDNPSDAASGGFVFPAARSRCRATRHWPTRARGSPRGSSTRRTAGNWCSPASSPGCSPATRC